MTISQIDGDAAVFSLYPASVETDEDSSTSRSSVNVSPLHDSTTMSSIAKVVEMVSPSSSNNSNGAWTTPTLPKMTQPTTVEKTFPPPRVPDLSSPPIQEKNPPHRKRRHTSSSNYIDNVGRGLWSYPLQDADGSDNINNIANSGDEIAWKIISVVLKGWCIIWVLFAILIISAELFSSNNSGSRSSNNASSKNIVIKIEDEQTFLEIAENVTSKCAYDNLNTERGREECQQLCFNHMCCFIDGSDADAQFEVHKYSCATDPNKMCAAYAGCESLVVAEDDAIIYNANGVDVFGKKKNTTDESMTNMENSQEEQYQSVTNTTTTSSELQLVQQVITSVCHKDNLHTRHGINECASLCNPSMCCFNRTEIEMINPRMDIKLKMEGISNDVLDRSVMGTCIHENDKGVGHRASIQNHFCNVHEGCQNILLLGAPPLSTLEKNRQKYQYHKGGQKSAAIDEDILIDYDGMIANSINGSNGSSITNDQERMLGTVFALLGIMVVISVYLLVHQRKPLEKAAQLEMTSGREETIEFV